MQAKVHIVEAKVLVQQIEVEEGHPHQN